MLAWLGAKHEVCPSCGTTEADWVEPGTGRLRDDPKWEAIPFRCHGCAETARAAKAVPDRADGVRIVLVPARERNDEDEEEV